MNKKYRLLYLFWLLPAYLLFLTAQQGMVHWGAVDTYENGTTYLAEIVDFEIKQIAAQSNGYVVIEFEADGEKIMRKLTLSIQMAQELLESQNVPIRYKKGNFQEIVLYPTYEIQRTTSLYNMSIAFISFIVVSIFGFFVNRYVKRKTGESLADDFNIERVD
jgi:hypothetical protein